MVSPFRDIKELTPLAKKLNIEMDTLADTAHSPGFNCKSTGRPPSRELGPTPLKHRVVHQCHSTALEQYTMKNTQIS